MAHEKYGTMKWKKLLFQAINLAINGFSLDYQNVMNLNSSYYREYLSNDIESEKIFSNKEFFKLYEKFYQKDLGNTLSRIADIGWEEFYAGKTADLIEKCIQRTGGLIQKEDLRNYRCIERPPVTFNYRGYEVHSMPPASS